MQNLVVHSNDSACRESALNVDEVKIFSEVVLVEPI